MPRASSSGKRQAASQRDSRHENGLVAPGGSKKIVRKRNQHATDAPESHEGRADAASPDGTALSISHVRTDLEDFPRPSSSLMASSSEPSASPAFLALFSPASVSPRPNQQPPLPEPILSPTQLTSHPVLRANMPTKLNNPRASFPECTATTTAASVASTTSTGSQIHNTIVSDGYEPYRCSTLNLASVPSTNAADSTLNGLQEVAHRRIDVNATRNSNVHRDIGPIDAAVAVLKSLPLQDTLAILIVLMQLPPLALSGVYLLFTLLTFVPPQASAATASSVSAQGANIMSVVEMLDWRTNLPSLLNLAFLNSLVLLLWLFLLPPLQDCVLEFAKPVVAVTLGGSSTSRDGTSTNTAATTCFLIVMAANLYRHISHSLWALTTKFLSLGWSTDAFGEVGILLSIPLHQSQGINLDIASDIYSSPERHATIFTGGGPHRWIRNVLAVHIVTQGLIRYIRDWYLRRERAGILPPGLSSSTTESGGTRSNTPSCSSEITPAIYAASSTPDPDSVLPHLQQTNPSAKKRKRLNTLVRLQQPLWAALASTKVAVMRDKELLLTAGRTSSSLSRLPDILGNAGFFLDPEQIWVSWVGCEEVSFSTSFFANHPPSANNFIPILPMPLSATDATLVCHAGATQAGEIASAGHLGSLTGANSTTYTLQPPFFVRVNGAPWKPTRLTKIPDERGHQASKEFERGYEYEDHDLELGFGNDRSYYQDHSLSLLVDGCSWNCDVLGLRPLSEYKVEFVHHQSEKVIYSIGIRTSPKPSAETKSIVLPVVPKPFQFESAAATLKSTIEEKETALAVERSKLKNSRKEWKIRLAMTRKEIEGLDGSLTTGTGSDDKIRQRIRQLDTIRAQAERETAGLQAELDALQASGSGPSDNTVSSRRKTTEKAWADEKHKLETSQQELIDQKGRLDKQIRALEDNRQNLRSKRSKVAARIAKVDKEVATIADANSRGLSEADRRRRERDAWQADAAAQEATMLDRLAGLRIANALKEEQVKAVLSTKHEGDKAVGVDSPSPPLAAVSAHGSRPPSASTVSTDRMAMRTACAVSPAFSQTSAFPESTWTPKSDHPHHSPAWPAAAAAVPFGLSLADQLSGAHQHSRTAARARSSSVLSNVSAASQSSAAMVRENGFAVSGLADAKLGHAVRPSFGVRSAKERGGSMRGSASLG